MVIREPAPLSAHRSMPCHAISLSGRMPDHMGMYQVKQQARRVPAAVVEAVEASKASGVSGMNIMY